MGAVRAGSTTREASRKQAGAGMRGEAGTGTRKLSDREGAREQGWQWQQVSWALVREDPEDDSSTWSHRDSRCFASHRNSGPVTGGDAVVMPAAGAHPGSVHSCSTSAAPGV